MKRLVEYSYSITINNKYNNKSEYEYETINMFKNDWDQYIIDNNLENINPMTYIKVMGNNQLTIYSVDIHKNVYGVK